MTAAADVPILHRLGVAFGPLVASLALGWLVMEGGVGLGGGEKDILLVMPLTAWSAVFAGASVALWSRQLPLGATSRRAALGATLALTVLIAAFFLQA